MHSLADRTRFIVLVAIGVAALSSGLAVASSGALTVGVDNGSATRTTRLGANSRDAALSVVQDGFGAAIQARTSATGGVAGSFDSTFGPAVEASGRDADQFVLRAVNRAQTSGDGGGARIDGQYGPGVVASSYARPGVVSRATGAAPAVDARAPYSSGTRSIGLGAAELDDCIGLPCAGTSSSGAIGALGSTGTVGGAGVYGVDATPDGTGRALVADGDALVDGDLQVSGRCFGCATSLIARNGTDATLPRGVAVAVDRILLAPDGSPVIIVRPARDAAEVIGIVDIGLTWVPTPGTDSALGGKWQVDGDAVAGGYLGVVAGGLLTLEDQPAGATAGDDLTVGASGALRGARAGEAGVARYLGATPDGRSVILVGSR